MENNNLKIILIPLFSALIVIGAYIVIPMVPVPITLQGLFILLAGYFLGAKAGVQSVVLYILIGLVGLPVFAGGLGGYQSIFRPSFGFLIGYIVTAGLAGYLTNGNRKYSYKEIFLRLLIANFVVFLIGVPYMILIIQYTTGNVVSLSKMIYSGFILFIPGDILKVVVATIIGKRLEFLKRTF